MSVETESRTAQLLKAMQQRCGAELVQALESLMTSITGTLALAFIKMEGVEEAQQPLEELTKALTAINANLQLMVYTGTDGEPTPLNQTMQPMPIEQLHDLVTLLVGMARASNANGSVEQVSPVTLGYLHKAVIQCEQRVGYLTVDDPHTALLRATLKGSAGRTCFHTMDSEGS